MRDRGAGSWLTTRDWIYCLLTIQVILSLRKTHEFELFRQSMMECAINKGIPRLCGSRNQKFKNATWTTKKKGNGLYVNKSSGIIRRCVLMQIRGFLCKAAISKHNLRLVERSARIRLPDRTGSPKIRRPLIKSLLCVRQWKDRARFIHKSRTVRSRFALKRTPAVIVLGWGERCLRFIDIVGRTFLWPIFPFARGIRNST